MQTSVDLLESAMVRRWASQTAVLKAPTTAEGMGHLSAEQMGHMWASMTVDPTEHCWEAMLAGWKALMMDQTMELKKGKQTVDKWETPKAAC